MAPRTMRAFVLSAPEAYAVEQVPVPVAGPGDAVIAVERVGVCGTDREFYLGNMPYVQQGLTTYPLRIGHEWCGRVTAVGAGVDPAWVGVRVMGDTMVGDGTCRRCRRGHQHVCRARREVGIFGLDGALAEQIAVPVSSLHVLPAAVDPVLGAMVEPGGNAWRAARATDAGPGDRVLVVGPGTIGTLTALFLRAAGAEVHVLGAVDSTLDFVRGLGFEHVWTSATLPDVPYDAVVDATWDPEVPAAALERVEPSGRVVYIGLARRPSPLDARRIAMQDVTVVGILSASPGLAPAIAAYASGAVDPRPLVAATLPLDAVGPYLAGQPVAGAGPGPKIHIDPTLR